MKQLVIAIALAGSITAGIVGLGQPTPASAAGGYEGSVEEIKRFCKGYDTSSGDWKVGADCDGAAQAYLDNLNWVLNGGASYLEECLSEGCSREEVSELHDSYKEEMIGESGGKYGEMMELAVGIWQRRTNGMQEGAFVMAMLGAFGERGWTVRDKDRTAALKRANGE